MIRGVCNISGGCVFTCLGASEATLRYDPAVGDWMRAAIPKAVAYARTLLPRAVGHQAEDVVQDVLCRLIATPGRYDLIRDGDKLLFRSVSNACINVRTRRRELASLDGWADDDSPNFLDGLAGDRDDQPDRRLMSAELESRVAEAIAELPALQRAVMALRAMDVSADQIGQALELTAGHVAVLTHRARRSLADRLADVLNEADR